MGVENDGIQSSNTPRAPAPAGIGKSMDPVLGRAQGNCHCFHIAGRLTMSEGVRRINTFVSKKISCVRWRPTAQDVLTPSSQFVSGSWDDEVKLLTQCLCVTGW